MDRESMILHYCLPPPSYSYMMRSWCRRACGPAPSMVVATSIRHAQERCNLLGRLQYGVVAHRYRSSSSKDERSLACLHNSKVRRSVSEIRNHIREELPSCDSFFARGKVYTGWWPSSCLGFIHAWLSSSWRVGSSLTYINPSQIVSRLTF